MNQPFHAGELELQRRAAALDQAAAVGGIIKHELTVGVANFLLRQRLAVASTIEPSGRVWASLLTGPAGFVRAVDKELVQIAVHPPAGHPLHDALAARPELGLLLFDPAARQRFRLNGRGLLAPQGLFLRVEQAYGNCPKYIQRRALTAEAGGSVARTARVTPALNRRQQDWIRRSDTLFIASYHPEGGADASHRGGHPGFVRVDGPKRLTFEDYPGNGMFNTLGNLIGHPQAGLLFVDFASGGVLQLAGPAEVRNDFSVVFDVEAVRETKGGSPLRYTFVEYSPANPRLSHWDGDEHLKHRAG